MAEVGVHHIILPDAELVGKQGLGACHLAFYHSVHLFGCLFQGAQIIEMHVGHAGPVGAVACARRLHSHGQRAVLHMGQDAGVAVTGSGCIGYGGAAVHLCSRF